MLRIGFIDYFLDEWHANNYPKWIENASGGEARVTCAYGKIASPRGVTSEAWCEKFGARCCESIAELVENSDGICVLSPDNCELHEELSALALASGKPVYIDKTFAPDLAAAKRLFEAAKRGGSPLWSSSALRFAEEYKGLTGARAISSFGPGELINYSIHQIEPIVMLMGKAPMRALCMPGKDVVTALFDFSDERTATMTCFAQGAPFTMSAAFEEGSRVITAQSDYFGAFIQALVALYQTGKPPVSPEETLAVMQARSLAVAASKTPGQWVSA